jgi:hypothetical protein
MHCAEHVKSTESLKTSDHLVRIVPFPLKPSGRKRKHRPIYINVITTRIFISKHHLCLQCIEQNMPAESTYMQGVELGPVGLIFTQINILGPVRLLDKASGAAGTKVWLQLQISNSSTDTGGIGGVLAQHCSMALVTFLSCYERDVADPLALEGGNLFTSSGGMWSENDLDLGGRVLNRQAASVHACCVHTCA